MGMPSPRLFELRRVAKLRDRSVSEILQYYAMERFLYRVGHSHYADAFVLKGGMLLRIWDVLSSRSTRDIDFLAYGANDLDAMRQCMVEICLQEVSEDGIEFDANALQVAAIKEQDEYQGVRVKFTAKLGSARIPMQLDIGFGDAVRPEILWEDYPVLLDAPAPRIRVYSRESIIAEKTHAMAKLGLINSRLKDYYDIWLLSRQWPFERTALVSAMEATFMARMTLIPLELAGLSPEYVRVHQAMWVNYLKKNGLRAELELGDIVSRLEAFLLPCLNAARTLDSSVTRWKPSQARWE